MGGIGYGCMPTGGCSLVHSMRLSPCGPTPQQMGKASWVSMQGRIWLGSLLSAACHPQLHFTPPSPPVLCLTRGMRLIWPEGVKTKTPRPSRSSVTHCTNSMAESTGGRGEMRLQGCDRHRKACALQLAHPWAVENQMDFRQGLLQTITLHNTMLRGSRRGVPAWARPPARQTMMPLPAPTPTPYLSGCPGTPPATGVWS